MKIHLNEQNRFTIGIVPRAFLKFGWKEFFIFPHVVFACILLLIFQQPHHVEILMHVGLWLKHVDLFLLLPQFSLVSNFYLCWQDIQFHWTLTLSGCWSAFSICFTTLLASSSVIGMWSCLHPMKHISNSADLWEKFPFP